MTGGLQLFDALDAATEAALRASIDRFGVLVAVTKAKSADTSLHGAILDGHHRSRIAGELGVKFAESWVDVADEAEAREIARTLNTDRRHLTIEQRRPVEVALREEGHSMRSIAGALGVDVKQVHRDLSGVDVSTPERVVGTDGKSYPAKRPAQVHVKPSETKRAAEALATSAPLGDGVVVDLKRAERVAREHQADQRRAEPVPVLDEADCVVLHGDFVEALAGRDLAGGVIISDPPYPREHLHLYDELAQFAHDAEIRQVVLLIGQSILPGVLDSFLQIGWTYRWCCAYMTPGPATRVWNANIGSAWKPVLIFQIDAEAAFVTSDVVTSTANDKTHHHWGQDADAFASLVQRFTAPGDLVVDPFLGGGTTALVARDLGRRFVGCDIDAAAVHATLARLEVAS